MAVLSYPVALEGAMAMPGSEGSVAAMFMLDIFARGRIRLATERWRGIPPSKSFSTISTARAGILK